MKLVVVWDIALCSPYMNERFTGKYHHLQRRISAEQEISVLVTLLHVSLLPQNCLVVTVWDIEIMGCLQYYHRTEIQNILR
jgi:hypothetical protein